MSGNQIKNGMLRPGDNEEEFKNKLKNPPKPINNTQPGPEMEAYLEKLNDSSNNIVEPKEIKEEEENIPICPHCRRQSIKRTPQGMYCCGFCGMQSTSPSYIYNKKR